LPDDYPTVGSQSQSAEINVAHFKSRIPQLLYTGINTTENGLATQCFGFTKNTHIFNTIFWRCPP
jgi:hypothetical protein